jgi:hypothetical protein
MEDGKLRGEQERKRRWAFSGATNDSMVGKCRWLLLPQLWLLGSVKFRSPRLEGVISSHSTTRIETSSL